MLRATTRVLFTRKKGLPLASLNYLTYSIPESSRLFGARESVLSWAKMRFEEKLNNMKRSI
jgi:hypothetical protein